MADRVDINVAVTLPPDLRLGVFANAFRVSLDAGDLFLDFVNYSEQEQVAQVVARVRVHPPFLLAMRARIDQTIQELQPPGDPDHIKDLTKDKPN